MPITIPELFQRLPGMPPVWPDDVRTMEIQQPEPPPVEPERPKGWSSIASDPTGWLTPQDVEKLRAAHYTHKRFNHRGDHIQVLVPKGGKARNMPGWDIFKHRFAPAEAARLEFDLSIEGPRWAVGGKILGLGGGGGAGGGYVAGKADLVGGLDGGWSVRILSGRAKGDRQGLRLYFYSQNRAELGAARSGSDNRLFGASAYDWVKFIPSGRYVRVALTAVCNEPAKANGSLMIDVDGERWVRRDGIMWQRSAQFLPVSFFYWSHMFGGNWEALPAPDRIEERYRNFTIITADRATALKS